MQSQDDVYTIPEWCAANKLSRATYYRLKKIGRGPKTMQVGDRELISREASAAWRAAVEANPIPPLNQKAT